MEELFKLLGVEEKIKNSVWDDYVPVVKDGNKISIYLNSSIETPDMYSKACNTLINANVEDDITIYLNTPGGMLDSAFMIADAMDRCKGKVTCDISGTVASAGTIIALKARYIRVAPYTAFMIHNYSGGLNGKGGELKAYQKFSEQELENTFNEVYKGFLTDEEIVNVIEDKDMWLNRKEVLKRWENRKAYIAAQG